MLKKLTLLCLGLLFGALTVMAQETTHVVKRGETLSTIATQYGVTIEAIKEANPLAGNMLYVGLKLQIPVKTETPAYEQEKSMTDAVEQPQSTASETSAATDYKTKESTTEKETNTWNSQAGDWMYYDTIRYNFLELGKAYSKFNNYNVDLHWGYFVATNLYLSPGFGYTHTFLTNKDLKTNEQNIALRVPIRIGYQLPVAKKSKLLLDFGPNMNYIIWGRQESGGQKIKFKDTGAKRFGVDASLGLHVVINEDWMVGVHYTTSFKHFMDDGVLGISLGIAMDY